MMRAMIAVVAAHALALSAQAQQIPRNEYLQNLPLQYPTMVRATEASAEVHLFGDSSDPRYRDSDPVDGIDDRRAAVLEALARRFAPYLVLNTTLIPMDVRRFTEGDASFPLYVDTWDVTRDRLSLVTSEEVPWQSLADSECDERSRPSRPDSPDCRLLTLLERFDPIGPGPAYQEGSVAAERDEFQVLFFDFPGHDEETWRDEFVGPYSGRLPVAYESYAKTFVHPFVESAMSERTGRRGYRLVLQYWFYYPYNDGGMNHEGDWEHINVVVAPLDDLREPLSRAQLDDVLAGGGLDDTAPDRLVIRAVDYYFHHFVMTLDYSRPNVYQPLEAWEQERDGLVRERRGEPWLWEQTRYYAYRDDAETEINTHPIGFIGADNKGNDQILKRPGGSNRDSHGTYPLPAIYKDVGPAGVAERIEQRFDHRAYFAGGGGSETVPVGGFGRGGVVGFTSPGRIEILPDGERVVTLVRHNPRARRDWAWLVLPLRWGYPASPSPFAWLVPHTDLGNGAPVGPAYNTAWNRTGDAVGYEAYAPHKFGSLFPLSWQDGFRNDLGYLNLTGPTLVVLPPFDLLWRVVAAPFRKAFGIQDPILQTGENIPFRVMSVSAGASHMGMSIDFGQLIRNELQVPGLAQRLADGLVRADSIVVEKEGHIGDATMTGGGISLYLGDRFASENALWHGRARMAQDIEMPTLNDIFPLRASLNFWEYAGSLRYNLTTGSLMPFVKAGYGWSWYRIEDFTTEGIPLPEPNGPWVRKPSLSEPSSLIPNTWHIGTGLEWVPVRSVASFPRGLDLGVRAGVVVYRHTLGLDIEGVLPTEAGIALNAGRVSSPTMTRWVYDLALVVSF